MQREPTRQASPPNGAGEACRTRREQHLKWLRCCSMKEKRLKCVWEEENGLPKPLSKPARSEVAIPALQPGLRLHCPTLGPISVNGSPRSGLHMHGNASPGCLNSKKRRPPSRDPTRPTQRHCTSPPAHKPSQGAHEAIVRTPQKCMLRKIKPDRPMSSTHGCRSPKSMSKEPTRQASQPTDIVEGQELHSQASTPKIHGKGARRHASTPHGPEEACRTRREQHLEWLRCCSVKEEGGPSEPRIGTRIPPTLGSHPPNVQCRNTTTIKSATVARAIPALQAGLG